MPSQRFLSLAVALAVASLIAVALLLPGCGDKTSEKPDDGTQPVEEQTPTDAPEEETVEFHTSDVQVQGNEIAVISTNKGVIKFEFYPEDAPNTVASFIELADSGYFDGIKFHRVEPGFVIQGGDPLSRTDDPMVGTGGPGWYLKAEFNERQHVLGSVAMARSQNPDSAGSQFYITLGPQPFLDGQYTVFGQVTEGIDVVQSIQVGDVMESVKIERP